MKNNLKKRFILLQHTFLSYHFLVHLFTKANLADFMQKKQIQQLETLYGFLLSFLLKVRFRWKLLKIPFVGLEAVWNSLYFKNKKRHMHVNVNIFPKVCFLKYLLECSYCVAYTSQIFISHDINDIICICSCCTYELLGRSIFK